MALSEHEADWLEGLFDATQAEADRLSGWESGFVADQQSRYEQYSSSLRLSAKQWAVLQRIAQKLGYAVPVGDPDGNA